MQQKAASASRVAIIDFEAPGLEDIICPIEVGVSIWQPGQPIRTWSSLIWREPDAYWSEKAEAVHHITRDMLIDAPKPATVAAQINELLGPIGRAFCDGMPFDDLWCQHLFLRAGFERSFDIWPLVFIPIVNGQRRVKWLQSNKDILHRAGPDTVRLMRAHAYMLKEKPKVIDIEPSKSSSFADHLTKFPSGVELNRNPSPSRDIDLSGDDGDET